MKMFELLPRPLGSIFRKLTHLTCNSRVAPPLSNHLKNKNRVGEERLPSHTTKHAGCWHFAVSAIQRRSFSVFSGSFLVASALAPCAHISALHFAAFCRQVFTVSRFTFLARRLCDPSP